MRVSNCCPDIIMTCCQSSTDQSLPNDKHCSPVGWLTPRGLFGNEAASCLLMAEHWKQPIALSTGRREQGGVMTAQHIDCDACCPCSAVSAIRFCTWDPARTSFWAIPAEADSEVGPMHPACQNFSRRSNVVHDEAQPAFQSASQAPDLTLLKPMSMSSSACPVI